MVGTTIREGFNARMGKALAANAANDYITAALREVALRGQWPGFHTSGSLSFTSGDKSKALPTDFMHLDRVHIADKWDLVSEDPGILRFCQDGANPVSGTPYFYCVLGGSLFARPIADASYTVAVDYWKVPAAVSVDTAALPLGDLFQEALILGTCLAYIKGLGLSKHPKLAGLQQAFDVEMARLTTTEDYKPTVCKPNRYGS